MAAGSVLGGNHSPRHLVDNQQSRPSPRPVSWNQVVRGESEHIAAAPSYPLKAATMPAPPQAAVDSSSPSSPLKALTMRVPLQDSVDPSSPSSPLGVTDDTCSTPVERSDGNAVKKPVWNRRSDGVSTEIEPVMGWNANWPALSKSTKSSTKSSSSTDLLAKGLDDGASVSEPLPQGTGSTPSFPQRDAGDNASTNHVGTARTKLSKHNAFSNGGYQQQSVPLGHLPTTSLKNSSPKEHTQRSGQSHNVHDHPQMQRNSFRNRNSGPHQRGDGSHHHSFGGRRDQDRGNQEWNNRNFNGRDNHLHPRGGPKFIRPALHPNSGPFIPPPVRLFGAPMAFPATPHDPLSGFPFVAPVPHPMFVHPQDPLLHSKIVNQIDYYFSNENLVRDIFLRRNMDDQGWVPASLIAHFNKVMQLTDNILNVPLILEALQNSSVVEVQGDKLRRRNDWSRWPMPRNVEFPKINGLQTNEKSTDEALAEQVGRIELERTSSGNSADNQVDGQAETFDMQTTFGVPSSQLQLSGGEATCNIGIEAATDLTN